MAREQGKLLPMLIDELTTEEFPMGFLFVQSAKLTLWQGDTHDEAWLKVQREVEAKLTPPWIRQSIDQLEAEILGERAGREAAERRNRTLKIK